MNYLQSMQTLRDIAAMIESTPRVHPNGFIQLDLDKDGRRRLHVWHPDLPFRQRTFHPVHNHIFGFTSEVFKGRLVHVEYRLCPSGTGSHVIFNAECISGSETVLRPAEDAVRYDLQKVDAFPVQRGELYAFPAWRFHETLANEPTLTILTKCTDFDEVSRGANCQGASILVPFGVTPDNDFRRDAFSQDDLWDLIEEALP